MMMGMAVEFAVLNGSATKGGESTGAIASTVMSEAVSSIRTVTSFGQEIIIIRKFAEAIDEHLKVAKIKAAFGGSARAYSQVRAIDRLCASPSGDVERRHL